MIFAFEVDTGARRTSRAGASPRRWRARLLLRPIGRTVYFMPPYIVDRRRVRAAGRRARARHRSDAAHDDRARRSRCWRCARCAVAAPRTPSCRAPVARAFLDAGIPLDSVGDRRAARSAQPRPLFAHDADAADESGVGDEARHDVRRARAARPRLPLEDRGVSRRHARRAARSTATSILKGYGDPKITIEQWQAFMADAARARASTAIDGDLVLDRSYFTLPRARPGGVRPASRCSPTTSAPTRCSSTSSRCASCSRPMPPATPCDRARRAAAARRSRSGGAAAARRRRLRRLARRARRARSSIAARSATATFAGRYRRDLRRARLVRGAARPSALRARHVHHVLPRRRRAVRRRRRRSGARRAAPRRSRRWNRRRSTTSCATSTSCRTT